MEENGHSLQMSVAFRSRLPYNSDLSKIRKFLEETDTVKLVFGRAGIAFASTSKGDECYYVAMIHACDIYNLYVDTEAWKDGGIVRVISTASFNNFTKGKESNADIQFLVDKDATVLTLSIISGTCKIREVQIPLITPDMMYEFPQITEANAVIPVNEFKRLASNLAKSSAEIKIESQVEGIRLTAIGGDPYTYGNFVEGDPSTTISHVKSVCFSKATKVNVGNAKSSFSGLYIQGDNPFFIKIRLGSVSFHIYSKRYFSA